MILDTVLTQLGLQRRRSNHLEAGLEAMRRDVNRIGKIVSQRAAHEAEEWGDHFAGLGRQAFRQGTHLAEIAGNQALRGAHQLRRDPLPAIAVIGTGLLLARLLSRR